VAQTTLPEHLLSQLHMTNLSEKELVVGEYIIWNINEDGYLTYPIELIAENLDVTLGEVEKVLHAIQHFDPMGIAARNLKECLLIQMMEIDPYNDVVIEILRDHFEDFTNKRYEKIIKKLEITEMDMRLAIEDITKLNPKPGEGYVLFHNNVIVPDIVVEREDDEFHIHMNDWNIPHLRINNSYKKLLLDKKKSSKETRDYIRQSLESARWLINSIHQRRATILKVIEAIIDKQREFFENGKEYLRPMILKDIADEIGMDISTISRVTNGKYVQTEYGVFELKYFFSERIRSDDGDDVSNKTIKNFIKEIIGKEDPNKPFNDQKIAEMLKVKGYNVARRTVAKYREQMMIPVSRLRRKI
jgi:RNA polymerase sigma-54 factor